MKLSEYQINLFLYNINVLKSMYKCNKDFFEKIGIDESSLCCWNARKRKPHFNTIYDICKKLNIDMYDLVNKRIKITYEFESLL